VHKEVVLQLHTGGDVVKVDGIVCVLLEPGHKQSANSAKFRAPLVGDPNWRLWEFISGEWNPAYSLLDMLCHDWPARPS
jgi:hypothetical protein